MMADTALTLQTTSTGDIFEFARYEIPEQISFGGEQRLSVHELVGGVRVIDAMGEQPMPIEWSGHFVGEAAMERALYLDGLRKGGLPCMLSWDALSFAVLIKSFHCDYKRFYRLPYRITCEVLADLTTPVNYIADPSIEQLMADDLASALGYGLGIGDSTLSGLLGALNTAISAVSSFAQAAQSTINSVLQPIAAVRTQVGILLAATNNTVRNVTTLGGILPSSPIAGQVGNLFTQINAVNQTPLLLNLDRVMGRMQGNLGTIGAGTSKMVSAGGNLYQLAAMQYGDAMGWTAIAQANGLTDPQISGVAQLTIPPYNSQADGVLNA